MRKGKVYMKNVLKIPLKERLQKAGCNVPNFLCVFEIFIEDYFKGMTQISGNPYFDMIYQSKIGKNNHNDEVAIFFAEMPQVARSMKEEEASELIYLILIEPFALIEKNKKEGRTYESIFIDT